MSNDKKIKDKYKLVVDEYFINNFNGAQAWMKFSKSKNEMASSVAFNRMLKNPKVQEYIQEKYLLMQEKSNLTHSDILDLLKGFLFLDVSNILKVDGDKITVKDFSKLTDIERKAIQSIKKGKEGIEITFFSKYNAMDMINKHLGFYDADNKGKNPFSSDGGVKEMNIVFKDFSEDD